MNYLHRLLLTASAVFFMAGSAIAQTPGTVTNHAFAIGKGAGQTGFTSLLCAATELAIGQSAANPACHALSGDITMNASGVTAIGAGKVTNSMLAGSIAASKLIGTDIATVGTITSGVWNGTTIAVANGGTGATTAVGARTNLGLTIGTNVQAWDADLDCIAAISTSGLITRTGSGTCASRQIVAPAAGIIITNPTGAAGDVTLALANDLAALEGLSSTGFAVRTATDTWAQRSITAATGLIITNPNGVSGNPNIEWNISALSTNGAPTGGSTFLPCETSGTMQKCDVADLGGGGSSGMTTTERQNFALNWIYQSKLLGDVRRGVNLFATGFKASSDTLRGIAAGSSSNYDTTNASASGYVNPTATTSTITSTASGSSGSFTGVTTNIDRTITLPNSVTISAIGFFSTGSGTGNIGVMQRNSSGNYTVVYQQTGVSHSGGGWQNFSASYTVPASGNYYLFGSNTGGSLTGTSSAARVQFSGATTSGSTYSGLTEDTGQMLPMRTNYISGFASMTLAVTTQTADSSVANGRVTLEFDNTNSPSINTDLTAEITCDNGSNWSAATLSAVTSYSQAGRKVAESADTSCTSGSAFAARIKTFNSKNVPIYGVALSVH